MPPESQARWAPPVRPALIRRLYAAGKAGFYDEGLLARVGWGLDARCHDVLAVHRAISEGEVPCPECGEIVHRPKRRARRQARPGSDPQFPCPECRRRLTWVQCRQALRHVPLCFDCTRRLDWHYAENRLTCRACGKEWTWQGYRSSVSRRVWLPCPHCGRRIRRPDRDAAAHAAGGEAEPEQVECPRCGGAALHEPGRLVCPQCGRQMPWRAYRKRQKRRAERLQCAACGHEFTWESWRRLYRDRNLVTGCPEPVAEFCRDWPDCATPQRQMMCIDVLLHAVHARGALGPVLIEGDEPSVMKLLDQLAQQQ
ncbi:MAG: hypothetical protein AMK73_06825 [Planctomycetes bacterium SM23_32]|nr:MAG: hypothetical protein AMK73_06825 [Planctomycetes bacterium SM23_32]